MALLRSLGATLLALAAATILLLASAYAQASSMQQLSFSRVNRPLI